MNPGQAHFWPQEHNLNKLGSGHLDDASISSFIPNIKALGHVVSDKKRFKDFRYAADLKHLNNYLRGPYRDHSCPV